MHGDDAMERFYLVQVQELEETKSFCKGVEDKLNALTDEIKHLRALVFGLYRPRMLPGEKIHLSQVSESRRLVMGTYVDYLTYEVDLTPVVPPSQSDVVKQLLKVSVTTGNTGSVAVAELDRDATKAVFEVPQDATVRLGLQYVDDAGNLSSITFSQEFVAKDSIAPNAPGDFGAITVKSERRVEIADSTPAPAEPAPTEPTPSEPTQEEPAPEEEVPAPSEPEAPVEVPVDPAPSTEEPVEEPAPVEEPVEEPAPEAPVEAPEAPEAPAEPEVTPEPPVVEEPVVEAPETPEEPVVEEPAPVEEAPAEEPVAVPAPEAPVEEPVVEEPVVEEPVVEETPEVSEEDDEASAE